MPLLNEECLLNTQTVWSIVGGSYSPSVRPIHKYWTCSCTHSQSEERKEQNVTDEDFLASWEVDKWTESSNQNMFILIGVLVKWAHFLQKKKKNKFCASCSLRLKVENPIIYLGTILRYLYLYLVLCYCIAYFYSTF